MNGIVGGPAPTPLSPSDGSVFGSYPRTTTLKWSAVPGATGYRVEVDYSMPNSSRWFLEETWESGFEDSTDHTFNHVGAQPGRWRVQAIFHSGHSTPAQFYTGYGPCSPWQQFNYTQ